MSCSRRSVCRQSGNYTVGPMGSYTPTTPAAPQVMLMRNGKTMLFTGKSLTYTRSYTSATNAASE